MRLVAVLAVWMLTAAAWGDTVAPPERAAEAPVTFPDAAEFSALLEQVPEQLEDCTLLNKPVHYQTAALCAHLGDAAELIMAYEHEWTVAAEYQMGANGLRLTVDVHRMSSALEAFGPFSRLRPHPADAPIGLRVPAYWTGVELHIWRGPFYIHLRPETEDPVWRVSVQQVAEALVSALPERAGFADMLRLLPGRRRAAILPRYYHGKVPALPLQGQALVATYTEKTATTCEVVLLRSPDAETASAAYEDLVAALASGEEAPEPLAEIAERAELFFSAKWGNCGIMQQDHYIAVVLGFTDRQLAEALLRMAATNVRVHLLMRPEDTAGTVSGGE